MALLAAASAACAQTVVPQQKSIGFSAAAIGTTAPQTLVAEFAVSGYTSSFNPTATMHYGHDYNLGPANCAPTGAGTETCSVSITFTPTLPGTRKDALLVSNGANTLATVLVYGVGQGPLAAIQPGVITQTPSPVYLYDAAVDENGTAYFNSENTGTIFSYTKAGVLTQLPVTGLAYPNHVAIDGAGTLYISQETYGNQIATYSASGVQGAVTVQPPAPYVPCANGIVNGSPIEYLYSVAVDGAGDIFALESLCNVIFELKTDGTYATFPIDPPLLQPAKLAVDDAGNLFIGGFSINELTAGGVQTEISTRENMASVNGNTDGLGVDASGLLYNTPYPGTLDGVGFGVAELPPSDYTTPELDLDAGAPLNGIGLGADGTFFGGGYLSFTRIDRSQGALTFGVQSIGVASAAQTVQLVNIGNQPLTISKITLTGDSGFATPATGTQDCANGTVLAPSAYCQVGVTLTPAHAGNATGSLIFSDNSQSTSDATQIVSLNGYVNGAYVTASPSALTFAPQLIVTTSPAQLVTLTNEAVSGSASIGTPVSSNPAFAVSANNCGAGVAPGASCQMMVTFTPSAAGSTSGTISADVSGGAPGETVSFGLSGTGLTPPASLSIAEMIQVSDSVLPTLSLALTVAEIIQIADAASLVPSVSLNVTETIQTADAQLLAPPAYLNVSETIHAADAALLAPSTLLNVTETIHAADLPMLAPSTSLNLTEIIHASDAPLLALPASLSITETIHVTDASSLVPSGDCRTIDYSKGFTAAGLSLNGGATVTDGLLQLTDGKPFEARSAFYSTKVPVGSFTLDVTLQLVDPMADGITFVLQSDSPKVVGQLGGGLGYAGIPNSVALKFDLHNNTGEGGNSTGVYIDGAFPSTPAIDLSPAGIDLHSGHVFAVHLVYANSVTTGSIKDTVTGKVGSMAFPGNLPAILGHEAYAGFTAGTGRLTAIQNVLTWSFRGGAGCSSN